MRYYLSKEDIEDGIICNIIEDETYSTRMSGNGFLIRHNFKEIISKDVVIMKQDGLVALRTIKHPSKITILKQSFDSWVSMMTGLNRLFICTETYGAKVLLESEYGDSIIPYSYYLWFKGSFGSKVAVNLIPKYYSKLKLEGIPVKTIELRNILEKGTHRLKFDFSKLIPEIKEVIIMPKKANQSGEYDVYVNNIHQRRLRGDHPWYGNWRNDSFYNDYRFLLNLDTPERTPTNTLGEYFVEMIPTSIEDVKFEIGLGRTLAEAEENASKIDSKAQISEFGVHAVSTTDPGATKLKEPLKRVPRKLKKQHKSLLSSFVKKTTKPCIRTIGLKNKPITPETEARIKREDYLKTSNQDIRKISKENLKRQLQAEHIRQVCVKDLTNNIIYRFTQQKANDLVNSNKDKYVFVSKQEWKAFKKKELKGTWNDGLVTKNGKKSKYTGTNRKARREFIYSNKDKKGSPISTPGHNTLTTRITVIKKLIPAHKEVVEVKTFVTKWEDIDRSIHAKDVDGNKIADVFIHKDMFLRKKRQWYNTDEMIWKKFGKNDWRKVPKWRYTIETDIITETVEVMVPARYVYKTVYNTVPLGIPGRARNRNTSYLPKIKGKPMKVKEKKIYDNSWKKPQLHGVKSEKNQKKLNDLLLKLRQRRLKKHSPVSNKAAVSLETT